jgi:hypothetical protein
LFVPGSTSSRFALLRFLELLVFVLRFFAELLALLDFRDRLFAAFFFATTSPFAEVLASREPPRRRKHPACRASIAVG